MSNPSEIRAGYNFDNVSVNYRYGSEVSKPISGFSEPINQKLINYALLGKSNPGVDLGATRFVAEPLFEEFDEIVTTNPGLFNTNSDVRTIQTTKILRLTGLNVINVGDGYSTANPITLTFSDLGNPRISGGEGQIFEQPRLDITTINNGGLGSFSITSSGRFEGSGVVQAFSGTISPFTREGTGFFGNQLSFSNFTHNTQVYSGTGTLIYNETIDGVTTGPITGTGSFSGNVAEQNNDDIFFGAFDQTSPTTQSIEIAFNTDDDDEFTFTETGVIFDPNTLIFTEPSIEPTYVINASNPPNIQDQDDIRAGDGEQINYSNWNLLAEDPIDRQAYTHVIRNPHVSRVSAILDIKSLSDTLHKADQSFVITDKPGLFGGNAEVDFQFRIGNPIDSFVTIRFEYGFLGTDYYNVVQATYNGQTIGGYLVESNSFSFASWKSLQQSDPKYSDLTIEQLKSSFPKYIRVSKDMFETSSSLITRNVALDSINEQLKTEYSYPSSAIVATKINSTHFNTIPTRTYDAKLKKVWVPETYNIEHFIEDKRFRRADVVPYDSSRLAYVNPTRVFNRYSRQSTSFNYHFGKSVAISDKTLFVHDPFWGNRGSSVTTTQDNGNIFVYQNLGRGIDHNQSIGSNMPVGLVANHYQMIRDGVPRAGNLQSIGTGPSNTFAGRFPMFDVVTTGGLSSNIVTTSNYRFFFSTITALIGLEPDIKEAIVPSPISFTHTLFLRISPKKSAILICSLNGQNLNASGAANIGSSTVLNSIVGAAVGVVIGLVEDPHQQVPSQVIRIVDSIRLVGNQFGAILSNAEIPITNTNEKKYIYVKFYSAQLRQVVRNRIVTVFGVIEYAELGAAFAEPVYDISGAHPNRIIISGCRLVDVSMKDYFFLQRPSCSEAQGRFFVHNAFKNAAAFGSTNSNNYRRVLLIFKKDVNGFWYPHQDISFINDSNIYAEAREVSFFPGDDSRFAIQWNSYRGTQIYKLNDSGFFALEQTVPEFEGFFEGFEIYSLNTANYGDISVVNEDTIIVSRDASIREGQLTYEELRKDTLSNTVFVYRRNQTNEWNLDQIIINPEFKSEIENRAANMKAHNEYLIISGREYDQAPYKRSDIGVVYLYRYNGKKYEFIRKFTSDTVKNLDANGTPLDDDFDSEFGDYIGLTVDENNNPVIITSASEEDPNGFIYIIQKDPNSDKWLTSKMNTFGLKTIEETNNYKQPRLAFDGKDVAFSLDHGIQLTDVTSVGVFSLKPPEKSTKLLAGNDWFGMMKRGWSDNPVWIIYDLLTNQTYGAGTALDDLKDINVFNFFEVAKYFDSADTDGFYVPIYDERGRTEPRLSCNFLLDTDFNAFDVISSICDMFFGAVYIKQGKYNIWADRPTETSWYFNNHDVLDGNFSYSDASRSKRPSLIRVPFLDKYEGFKEKVEFIEDSDLMRKNGKNEVKLDFATFTTRSQARRFGKHYLYNQSYETEKIKFLTDSKALFLNPGDVIGVNDKLKSFKNEKLFYEVEDVSHIEKVYAVTNTKNRSDSTTTSNNGSIRKFTLSEITFKNSDTENFDVKYVDKENSTNASFFDLNLSLDNDGVPYVIAPIQGGDCNVYKKNGDDFDEVIFEEGIHYSFTSQFKTNLAFDSSNNPYFSLIEGGTTDPTISFCKLTGSDFTNTQDWQFTQIENLDAASEGFTANVDLKSIIRINSNNEKFIFTFRIDTSPSTGEYLLFHNNGIDDDTNPNNWNRYVIDSHGSANSRIDFEMQLTNDGNPAVLFSRPVENDISFDYFRYKEFVGSNLGNQADWSGVFVQGGGTSFNRYDNCDLTFDKSGIPYIVHNYAGTQGNDAQHIFSPLSYAGRFDYDNWSYNSKFIRYSYAEVEHKMQLEILQNGNVIIFTADYRKINYSVNRSAVQRRSLQFQEALSTDDWDKYHNWNKQSVYETDITIGANNRPLNPSTAHDYQGCTITLKNADAFIYDKAFSIDTSIKNNLEITNLFAGDISGLYHETQFENFSAKIRENANVESSYLTITGFETSGVYINLFAEDSVNTAKIIKELVVDNPMVRPVTVEEDLYKEYRILNILEKESNLYEIEAKEYFSDKFDIIDTYASIVEPEQAEYNIGLPDNKVMRPPEPSGIEFVTGLDDAGSPFLTGLITGEPNGSETEYRLSLLYPNGRIVQKEIEKDTLNLSSSNEFLTNFGFYNLAVFGNYELDVTSLRNPESSASVNEKFTISELKEKLSVCPFIDNIDLLVIEDLLKIKIGSKNVYGEKLNLYDSNCRVNLIIEGETYVENSKMTDFEISFQQIKDLTNSDSREKEIKAELTYNESVISEKSKILKDKAPVINNINFVSDGSSANIAAEISESEKLISVDMKTGETVIKTFGIQNQNKLQNFKLQDFEVSTLPKNQKIDFTFTPKDFYGTGQSYICEGYIPKKETVFEKYNNSIIPIYSIYSEDIISTGFSYYESSNNQSGFYGNGKDCLVEFSSSLLSGQSASLNLELVSDTESSLVSIKFEDEGYLSSKKVLNLSSKYHDVRVSGESGLFGGFDLKVKKLV